MTPWNELLDALASAPRENGTEAIQRSAEFLQQAMQRAGVPVELVPFTAQPYRLRLLGVVALLAGAGYFLALRARRPWRALAIAVAAPVVMLVELDYYVPLVGWIGARPQHHIVATLPARAPAQRLLFAAHYDTKTDLFDHLERAPIDFLGVPLALLMVAGAVAACAGRVPRLAAIAERGALAYGVATFATLTAGAFVPSRSPGALDNGGACAVLVRLAERLHAELPRERTVVELVWPAAEEVGVQGSWEYARTRFAAPPPGPTLAVNLEFIGAASDLAVFGRERFALRSYPVHPSLLKILNKTYRAARGKPLHVTWYGASTDARSFLAHGIPTLTLLSDLPAHAIPRDLHSAGDQRGRIHEAALDATVDYLLAIVRTIDAQPLVVRSDGR